MSFPTRVRKIIHERAGGHCERCGRPISDSMARSIHHRRPRGMGGSRNEVTNSAVNGILLCGSGTTGCHGEIESNRLAAIAMGQIVPQHDNPAEVPVVLAAGLVILDAEGNYHHQEYLT